MKGLLVFGVAALGVSGFMTLAHAAGDRDVGTERELTLEEALALGRRQNRNLAVEKARLQQARTSVEQAWATLFPTVAAQGRFAHNYKQFELPFAGAPLLVQPSEQFDASINFVQPLIAPAAYPALRAVKNNVATAEAGFEVTEASVLISVAQTFYAAWIADEVLIARRSNIDVARATLENATTRFDAGTVTKVDVDRAELALVGAEQMAREAEQGRHQTYRALATLIQLEEPFVVKVTAREPEKHDERDLASALSLRPEFRALEFTLQSAKDERSAYAWRWAPTFSMFGNARRFNYDNFARDRYSWAVGAQLDWVLYDGGARDAERHRAAARALEAEARTALLRDQIRDDLADGRLRLETKLAGLQAADRSVQLAQETLDLVRAQYEVGLITQVDLLVAQDELANAEVGLARARFAVAAADLMLRHAAGTFPPR